MSTDLLVEPSRQTRGQRAIGTLLRSRELSIAIVLVLIVAAATARRSQFVFSGDGWRDTLLTPSILLLLAVGQMVVIVTRNVDLSVGSTLGRHGVLHRQDLHRQPGHPGPRWCSWPAAHRGRARRRERVPRRLLPGAGPRGHARHDVCLPRLPHEQVATSRIVAGDIPANFEKLGTRQT